MPQEYYENPLTTRYASRVMASLFAPKTKHRLWRRLWVALAKAEADLGLPITREQIAELEAHVEEIDFSAAEVYEKKFRHDVMAHLHAFGDCCPNARPIIHLGATSCFVTDNADLIVLRDALRITAARLAATIISLSDFAAEYRDLPTLGFTHLQPAQPTTVGKRACLWAYDMVLDLEEIERRIASLRFRSAQGTTGTQASFLALFGGDSKQVKRLETEIAEQMGFDEVFAVTGQTYSRKIDSQILDSIAGIAASAHKMATDVRLLASRKEIEEPFESDQIGSSAMAYKRNPMRSERICSLSRFAMSLPANGLATHANQWMERTLDDSANRRIVLPEAFLAVDSILILCENVASGLVVYPAVIGRHLREELPFLASENILMAAVAAGGDRQELHERIRRHSQAAASAIKMDGKDNDLLDRLAADDAFRAVDLNAAVDPASLTGRADEQVGSFLEMVVAPIREKYKNERIGVDPLRV